MSYFMVDIEADGPIPGDYSMVSFAAILVDKELETIFYGELKPISDKWKVEALAVSNLTREKTLTFDDPKEVMERFAAWIKEHNKGKKVLISDNNGFDWQFINWYFHHFLGENPFGFASTNLNSLYKGIMKDTSKSFKYMRKTEHTHHPVDDAKGDAEAFLEIIEKFNLKIQL